MAGLFVWRSSDMHLPCDHRATHTLDTRREGYRVRMGFSHVMRVPVDS